MTKRNRLTSLEALDLWEDLNKKGEVKAKPDHNNLVRYATRYEGILSFRTTSTGNRWFYDREVLIEYLTKGFPDIEIMQPVMRVRTALRYLHANGISPNYKLRELRKDLDELGWIIRSDKGPKGDRVTRSHLNKFIGMWNGNR